MEFTSFQIPVVVNPQLFWTSEKSQHGLWENRNTEKKNKKRERGNWDPTEDCFYFCVASLCWHDWQVCLQAVAA